MKKIISIVAVALLAASLFAETIKVGATPVPHADILNLVKDDLKAEGIDLKVI